MTQSKFLLSLFTIFFLASIYDITTGIKCWEYSKDPSSGDEPQESKQECSTCLKGFKHHEDTFSGKPRRWKDIKLGCGPAKCTDPLDLKDAENITCCSKKEMCNTGLTCYEGEGKNPRLSKPFCAACETEQDHKSGEFEYSCLWHTCRKNMDFDPQRCCEDKDKCNDPATGLGITEPPTTKKPSVKPTKKEPTKPPVKPTKKEPTKPPVKQTERGHRETISEADRWESQDHHRSRRSVSGIQSPGLGPRRNHGGRRNLSL